MTATKLATTLDEIAAMGFESVRFAVDWGYLSNIFGSTNYAPVIAVKNALVARDLIPMPCLGIHYPLNHNATAFGNFVGKCVEIFGDVPYYEVWNEPNLIAFYIGTPATYVTYLKAAAPHIRAVGSQVISGGMAAYPTFQSPLGKNWSPVDWLNGMYAGGENGDYDLLGYHPYSIKDDQNATFVDPQTNPFGIAQINALKAVQASHSDTRPMAFTEVGYITPGKVTEQDASNWLTWQLANQDPNFPVTWFFCYQDTAGDGGGYGITTTTGAHKGVYYDTVAAMV
ncbi:hypothetical protein [Mycobacterium sp. MS1601]|uniref:hypothetical protein n=1 Tax=Mycobacterium sp. MS1601 TaxID=1936029 RepID=UPI0012FB089C|nr:hypothetical protein [Mycobacterium sp. MS1601]